MAVYQFQQKLLKTCKLYYQSMVRRKFKLKKIIKRGTVSLHDIYFLKTTWFLRRRSWTTKHSWQETAPYYCIPLGLWARIYNFGFKQDTQCPCTKDWLWTLPRTYSHFSWPKFLTIIWLPNHLFWGLLRQTLGSKSFHFHLDISCDWLQQSLFSL